MVAALGPKLAEYRYIARANKKKQLRDSQKSNFHQFPNLSGYRAFSQLSSEPQQAKHH
jgi:hypothetical protein